MGVALLVGEARDLLGEGPDRVECGDDGRRAAVPSPDGTPGAAGTQPANRTSEDDSDHEGHAGDHNDRVRH